MRPERAMRAVPSEDGPTFELVREDPPDRGKGSSIAGRYADLLTEVAASPGVWFRVATFPGKTQANSAHTACKKAYPLYEFSARRLGDGSGLWAKFTG